MVEIRTVREEDLAAFRRLHNHYIDRDESIETVREWYDTHPELLVGAYADGQLIGHCLGLPWDETTVELNGISVENAHQQRGIGGRLLAAFERRAADAGFRRVTLGSAGGYVDEFYHDNGYTAARILAWPDDGTDLDALQQRFDDAEAVEEDGTRKLYVDVDGFEPTVLAEVQETVDDGAIYIMRKSLAEA